MRLRKDSHYADVRTRIEEDLDGPLKYGLAIQFEELFRHFGSHSRTASGGHDYSIFFPCHPSAAFRKKINISYDISSAKLSYFL